jgi:hypothetical protein
MWIVRRNKKDISVELATIRRWAAVGYLKPDDLLLRPDSHEWMRPDQVPELRQSNADSVASTEAAKPSGALVIRQGGQEYRAADQETLRTWVREGRILRDSTYFDESSNRWLYVRTLADFASGTPSNIPLKIVDVARNYRNLVVWVGIQVLFSVWFALADSLALLVAPILFVSIVALAYYAHETAKALGSPSALLWGAAMLIPCVNLFTLFALNSRASEVCRANGIRVGFLGPEL